MIEKDKCEELLQRISEIKSEGIKLREEISQNPTLHKVFNSKLEKLEIELVECTQEFISLTGLENAFANFKNKDKA
ncbi:MAG: hypothetical protein ACW99G_03085 [Candidatus Thorarchaeota archaeon]|jgi:hypothetical protein